MVSIYNTGIRYETVELGVAREGATSLYVDTDSEAASDDNEGYSWADPLKTISEAVKRAMTWTKIWVRGGEYYDNIVISADNVHIYGAARDGDERVVIRNLDDKKPVIKITGNACYIENIAVEANNVDSIVIESSPNNTLRNLYVENDSDGLDPYYGIYLNDADSTIIDHCHITAESADIDKLIGVMIDNGSVNCRLTNSVITGLGGDSGSHTGYGVAIDDAQRILIEENTITNCSVGIYFYERDDVISTAVLHNVFAENRDYDVYDPNNPSRSGTLIDSNFYGYDGWFTDSNYDGVADTVVSCFNNYDVHPLSNPWAWKIMSVPPRMEEA